MKKLIFVGASIFTFAACAAAEQTADVVTTEAANAAQAVKEAVTTAPGVDISAISSGEYKAEKTHAYIAFSYTHLGYSKPILRWGAFDATVNLDSENPQNSTLDVTIDAAAIDSGVDVFDGHLRSDNFFDTDNYPEITFTATDVNQAVQGSGTLTGDLTIKGVTKPVTLDVVLNQAGTHPLAKKEAFGISATAVVNRSDWGLSAYVPNVSDAVNLNIEIEFLKEG